MHTISAKSDKGFKVEVYNNENEVVYSAYHMDRNEAQAVADREQRKVLFPQSAITLDDIFAEMSDDELLAELGL